MGKALERNLLAKLTARLRGFRFVTMMMVMPMRRWVPTHQMLVVVTVVTVVVAVVTTVVTTVGVVMTVVVVVVVVVTGVMTRR